MTPEVTTQVEAIQSRYNVVLNAYRQIESLEQEVKQKSDCYHDTMGQWLYTPFDNIAWGFCKLVGNIQHDCVTKVVRLLNETMTPNISYKDVDFQKMIDGEDRNNVNFDSSILVRFFESRASNPQEQDQTAMEQIRQLVRDALPCTWSGDRKFSPFRDGSKIILHVRTWQSPQYEGDEGRLYIDDRSRKEIEAVDKFISILKGANPREALADNGLLISLKNESPTSFYLKRYFGNSIVSVRFYKNSKVEIQLESEELAKKFESTATNPEEIL